MIFILSCTRQIDSNENTYTPTTDEILALKTIKSILLTQPESISTFFPWVSNDQGYYTAAFSLTTQMGSFTGLYQLNYLDENQNPIINSLELHPSTLVTPNTTHYSIERYDLYLGNIQKNNIITSHHQFVTSNNTITYDLEKTVSITATWSALASENITFELNGSSSIISNTNYLTNTQSFSEYLAFPVTLNINSNQYIGTFSNAIETSTYYETSLIDTISSTIKKSEKEIGILKWDILNEKIQILDLNGNEIE